MLDEERLVDSEGVHHRLQIDGRRHLLVGRQEVLEHEPLIHARREPVEVALPGDLVVRIDLSEDMAPAGHVVVARLVSRRRGGEDRLVDRREAPVGGRAPEVALDVVLDPLCEGRQPAMERHAHGDSLGEDDVLAHCQFDHLDGRLDRAYIAAIVREARATGVVDGMIDHARHGIDPRFEHAGIEVEGNERGREMQLARLQDLHPVGAVRGRVRLVECVEVDLVVPQHELARLAELLLKLERAVEIARPDVEGSVPVGDLDRVVHHLAVDLVDADPLDLKRGERIHSERLHAPFEAAFGGLSEHILQRGRGDGKPLRVQHRRAAGEHP